MKRNFKYLLPALLLFSAEARAQGIRIMPGTTFKIVDTPYTVVLKDGYHFENNTPVTGNLILKATGTGNSEVKGAGSLALTQIQMNKTSGQELILQKDVNVADGVYFTSGLLNLNGNDVILAGTASLVNESESSRVIGPAGGAVQITQTLDQPLAENPGNLGLVITSGSNWGSTIIRRGSAAFTNGGGGSSILRSFEVTPANNTGLSAFLRMYYRQAELNGLDENTFDFFASNNSGATWTNIGTSGRNTTQNFVNISGVQTMSLFTLSTTNNPLPIQLREFTTSCVDNKVMLQWRVDNPMSIDFFRIEKSNDGSEWENIADKIEVKASPGYAYSFTDITAPSRYYRLQAVERDGMSSFSPVQQVNCNEDGHTFRLMQNPVKGAVPIAIQSKTALDVTLAIYDLEGRTILQRDVNIAAGKSKLNIDISAVANGMYLLQIKHQQGTLWQTKFIK